MAMPPHPIVFDHLDWVDRAFYRAAFEPRPVRIQIALTDMAIFSGARTQMQAAIEANASFGRRPHA